MKMRAARTLAGLIAASGISIALAQQAAPPPPTFAPANLTPAGVRAMAANCAACHGTNGHPAAGSTAPKLTGRASSELIQIMGQFREGKKPATLMHQIAKGYSPEETAAIADYFAKQP
jgi:sulfide dehydrogenase cytochrome subunit